MERGWDGNPRLFVWFGGGGDGVGVTAAFEDLIGFAGLHEEGADGGVGGVLDAWSRVGCGGLFGGVGHGEADGVGEEELAFGL